MGHDVVEDSYVNNILELESDNLAANIANRSDFEKQLIKNGQIVYRNNRPFVKAANNNQSRLWEALYNRSDDPMRDYEMVHNHDFIKHFGDWRKAQAEWLSGEKTWIQAVRSNGIDETMVDDNLEPTIDSIYYTESDKGKATQSKLNNILSRVGTSIAIVSSLPMSDQDVLSRNQEEIINQFGFYDQDVILSTRPDIVSWARKLEDSTQAWYDGDKINYRPSDKEWESILKRFNIKTIC
jgi:hypothetical protein